MRHDHSGSVTDGAQMKFFPKHTKPTKLFQRSFASFHLPNIILHVVVVLNSSSTPPPKSFEENLKIISAFIQLRKLPRT